MSKKMQDFLYWVTVIAVSLIALGFTAYVLVFFYWVISMMLS